MARAYHPSSQHQTQIFPKPGGDPGLHDFQGHCPPRLLLERFIDNAQPAATDDPPDGVLADFFREGLEAEARRRVIQELDEQILDQLIERNEVPVPPTMTGSRPREAISWKTRYASRW